MELAQATAKSDVTVVESVTSQSRLEHVQVEEQARVIFSTHSNVTVDIC